MEYARVELRARMQSMCLTEDFRAPANAVKDFRRGGSSVKSAIYPRSRHEFEAHSPLHHLNSVQRPELERGVVGGQAERGAAVGRGGDVGVVIEGLLHRVRVAEGARRGARS